MRRSLEPCSASLSTRCARRISRSQSHSSPSSGVASALRTRLGPQYPAPITASPMGGIEFPLFVRDGCYGVVNTTSTQ